LHGSLIRNYLGGKNRVFNRGCHTLVLEVEVPRLTVRRPPDGPEREKTPLRAGGLLSQVEWLLLLMQW